MAHTLSIGGAVANGWKVFAKQPWFFIGLSFLLMVVAFFGQAVTIGFDVLTPDSWEQAGGAEVAAVALGGFGGLVFALLTWVVQQYLAVGVAKISLEAVRGKSATFGMLSIEPVLFLNAVLAGVLVGFLVMAGFIALVIPGIYVGLALSLVVYALIDEKLGPVEAVQRGWNVTKGNRGRLFLLFLLTGLINLAGLLALFVGLFVTIPVTWLAVADAYRQLKG